LIAMHTRRGCLCDGALTAEPRRPRLGYIDHKYIPSAEGAKAMETEIPDAIPSTGTIDDDDEPEDEHDGENEASGREKRDDTEAPEEFERDDEDRE